MKNSIIQDNNDLKVKVSDKVIEAEEAGNFLTATGGFCPVYHTDHQGYLFKGFRIQRVFSPVL
jgi:hypothetical protein